MGGVVSSGQNNDDLIDNLLEADYIKTPIIERVFRGVDRAEYFLPEGRVNAYKDLAWKYGNLHLSAPCVYSEVMEGLCLVPGLSFLNLGSGTGYLSTMVGLILGTYGINHGIEYHKEVVQYANKKLEDFKKRSGSIDEFDFCEPKFIQGNCLCLSTDCYAQYDRVYCGAACPEQYQSYMKNLIKVGGILVIPLNDQLMQIKRNSETNWESKSLLPVSFASLIQPVDCQCQQDWVQMIETEPLHLQVLCRSTIRNILRINVEKEHPPVKRQPVLNKAPKKKRALRRLVIPLFDDEDSSDDDRQVRIVGGRNRDGARATLREDDALLNFVLGTFRGGRNIFAASHPNETNSSTREDNTEVEQSSEDNRMETDTTESAEESFKKPVDETKIQTQAIIEHSPSISSNLHDEEKTTEEKIVKTPAPTEQVPLNPHENQEQEPIDEALESIDEIHNVFVDVLDVLRRERESQDEEDTRNSSDTDYENDEKDPKIEKQREIDQSGPSTVDVQDLHERRNKKREKFDSGLGDEIVENHSESSEGDFFAEDLHSSSDDEGARKEKRNKRTHKSDNRNPPGFKWRPVDTGIQSMMVTNSSSDNDTEEPKIDNEMKMYKSSYTEHMKAKIQQLPLPTILKRYLNHCRDF